MEVDAERVLKRRDRAVWSGGTLRRAGWEGMGVLGSTTQFPDGGLGPGGGGWDAADDEAVRGPVRVALDPHGWDPADLVVEAGAGSDADTAEVAGAQVRDRGSPAGWWRLVWHDARRAGAGDAAAKVQDADADQCALAFPDLDRVVLECLAELPVVGVGRDVGAGGGCRQGPQATAAATLSISGPRCAAARQPRTAPRMRSIEAGQG